MTSNYRNFAVAIYARAQEVQHMADPAWLQPRWKTIADQVKVDKIYLETHRDVVLVDEATMAQAKDFFQRQGLRVAGGITYTINERKRFETFCYSNPEQRQRARHIAEHTARLFDEFILDDFFFTNCKCPLCIAAKGTRSWTQYRLDLMEQAAHELIIQPAKAVNPNVKVVIKFPNWYEHFQGLGFHLEAEPRLFDGIYTGTETRHPTHNHQHLQQYQSECIVRYFENIAPGRNGGGWVDPFGMRYLDRYAEQLWLTLFAKAREITLFDFGNLCQRRITPADRAAWQGTAPTSFDFDATVAPFRQPDGTFPPQLTVARAAGVVFDQVDQFLGQLGKPIGIKSYRPYHSTGEDFLHNYLGMIGIPMDIVPQFPHDAAMVLLTESAAADSAIVDKIKRQLQEGKSVVITSGLLKALQGKGIEDIAEIRYTDKKVLTDEFYRRADIYRAQKPIILPQIEYLTNDTWETIGCGANGYPLLLQASYAKGMLNVLTIPDDFSDLYALPAEVLTLLRDILMKDFPVRIEAPAQVSLFAYDNNTLIVESFLPQSTDARVVVPKPNAVLRDLLSGQAIPGRQRGEETVFDIHLWPHSYRVFAVGE